MAKLGTCRSESGPVSFYGHKRGDRKASPVAVHHAIGRLESMGWRFKEQTRGKRYRFTHHDGRKLSLSIAELRESFDNPPL